MVDGMRQIFMISSFLTTYHLTIHHLIYIVNRLNKYYERTADLFYETYLQNMGERKREMRWWMVDEMI